MTQTEMVPADVKGYPRPVRDLLRLLVNERGIKWRPIDAKHLLIYPPDGTSRPFKVAAARPEEASVRYIRDQFMQPHGIPDEDGLVPRAASEADAGVSEAASTSVDPTTTPDVPDAQAAILELAARLGVNLSGGVSEEEYLAVVAEKDQALADNAALVEEANAARREANEWATQYVEMEVHRNALLEAVNTAFEALEVARA